MLSVDVSSAGSVQVRSPYDGLISLSLSPLNIPHHHHHHPTEFWECLVCCHLWTSRPSRSHVHTRTCVAGGISKNALAPHTHTHTTLPLPATTTTISTPHLPLMETTFLCCLPSCLEESKDIRDVWSRLEIRGKSCSQHGGVTAAQQGFWERGVAMRPTSNIRIITVAGNQSLLWFTFISMSAVVYFNSVNTIKTVCT